MSTTTTTGAGTATLHHAGIDVDDLAAQTRFYRAAFDLAVLHEATLPEFDFTFVLLASAAGWAVELFKREGAAPRPQPDDPDGQHDVLGLGHVCFTVDDVCAVHDHLVALGAHSRTAPTASPHPRRGPGLPGRPGGQPDRAAQQVTGGPSGALGRSSAGAALHRVAGSHP